MLKIMCITLIVIQYFSDNGKNKVSHQISKYSFSEKKELNRSSALGRKFFRKERLE